LIANGEFRPVVSKEALFRSNKSSFVIGAGKFKELVNSIDNICIYTLRQELLLRFKMEGWSRLVMIPALHAGGHGFKSHSLHSVHGFYLRYFERSGKFSFSLNDINGSSGVRK
jgi:hypothetical protein